MQPKHEDEIHLIRQIREGDTALFRVLVDRYKEVSLSLACSLVKDKAWAEDLLQDAFIKAFQKLDRFHQKANFSTWFYRIVVNTCYNALAKQQTHQKHAESIANETPGSEEPTFSQLVKQERGTIIHEVLQELKSQEALLLRLFYLGEQSISEIASITGLKKSHIKVTLHRGRKNFHEALKEKLGHEKWDLL